MTTWPAWFPGLPLKSQHLLGLEDYLLSRAKLEAPDTGLESFDWISSLKSESSEIGWQLSVLSATGLTNAGQPVKVTPSDRLTRTLPETKYGPIDIYVAVNEGSNAVEPSSKLSLEVATVTEGEASKNRSNWLHLGCYQVDTSGARRLLKRPRVRCLAACQPLDDRWASWVAPFKATLALTVEQLEKQLDHLGWQGAAAMGELARISFEWPYVPISVLVNRLHYVRWLIKRRHHHARRLSDAPFPSKNTNLDDVDSEDLPGALAALLDVEFQMNSDVMQELLWPIYHHAPLAELQEWSGRILKSRDRGTREEVEQTLSKSRASKDDWTLAVALLSIYLLYGRSQEAVPETIRSYAPGGDDLARSIVTTLRRLLRDAEKAPAGPAVLFHLAQVVGSDRSIQLASPRELNAYLDLVNGRPPKDRVSGEVGRFATLRSSASVETTSQIEPVAIFPPSAPVGPGEELRVVILGPDGSGKRSLVQQWLEFTQSSTEPRVSTRVRFAARPLRGDGRDVVRIDGTVVGGTASCRLAVHVARESALDKESQSLAEIEGANLLVLALHPRVLDRPQPPTRYIEAMADAIRRLSARGKPSMVALCFTKADEYGSFDPGSIRILMNASDFGALDRVRDGSGREWQRFVEAISDTERHSLNHHRTRNLVMKQTEFLWREALKLGQATAVNGYFLAADPVDDFYRPWSRRGFLQLFADFFDRVGLTAQQ